MNLKMTTIAICRSDMFLKNNLEKYITKMSLKDLGKFCGIFSEKQKENNEKKIVYKNNKIYKPLSEFTDEDWKEASRRAEETDIIDFIDNYFDPDMLREEAELLSRFTECDQRVSFIRESRDGKYGLIDGNGRIVCPFVCDSIKFLPPLRIALITYKGLDFNLGRYSSWYSFLLRSNAWGIPYDMSIPYILVFDSCDSFLNHYRRAQRILKIEYEQYEEEMKVVYDEFMAIIKEHNSIITREEVLAMTDNNDVKRYLERMSSHNEEHKNPSR